MHEPTGASFADLTIREFAARLGSAAPVPGGGSASAVAGALGASLVAMVAALSEGRPKYAEHAALHAEARSVGERVTAKLLALADEDAEAYAAFAAAMKLARDTPANAAARTAAMQAAARWAAEVPLRCVETCVELVLAAETLAGRSNRNAASDLNVAAMLGEAAARGAAANVLVNLPSLDQADPFVGEATVRVDRLLHEIGRLADATRAAVLSGAARDPIEPTEPAEPGEPSEPTPARERR
jgi:formiminotetrahydrofolate cyclodeaminase